MISINLDYADLPAIIEILDDALLNRPIPSGYPHLDIDSAICSASDYSDAINELSKPGVVLDAWHFQYFAKKLSNGYKTFWMRPFPYGLERGQFLFSAILEKVIRDLSQNLKKILKEKEFKNDRPFISLNAEVEVRNFTLWLEGLENDELSFSSSNKKKSSSNCKLLLAAALFGFWLGG